jgi:glycosyltransferase involved in cell wall biosynthesis
MNIGISVVIIARNESKNIQACIHSARRISNDILVIDNDSADEMPKLVIESGARYFNNEWKGYSNQKNFGNSQAQNDWIFSLDADERISEELANEINEIKTKLKDEVYLVNRLNHLGEKAIYFGEWNPDWQKRLFNRKTNHWDESKVVHEELLVNENQSTQKLKARLLHYTTPNSEHYRNKMEIYAKLHRENLKKQGRTIPFYKGMSSALFGFFREYLLKLGFLDGKEGLQLAILHFNYTRNKYKN